MCLELPIYQRLDDEQKDVYDMDLMGRYLVEGPPGTGKSVVALHRAAKFAKNNQEAIVLMYNRPLLLWTKEALTKALSAAKCSPTQTKLISTNTTEVWFKSWYSKTFEEAPPLVTSPKMPNRNIVTKYDGKCKVCERATVKTVDRTVTFGGKWIPVHAQCLDALCIEMGYTGPDWGPALIEHAGTRMSEALKRCGQTLNLVIDEGQDLANNFYEVVSPFCQSITVYADEAQIVSDEKSLPIDIARILEIDPLNKKRLSTNYRNRAEVADLAAKFRPKRDAAAIAQKTKCSQPPVIINFSSPDALEKHVRTLHSNFGQKSIGIFFKFNQGKEGREDFARRFSEDSWVSVYVDYKSKVDLCAPGALVANTQVSKGLEFDIVILADLQNWPSEPAGREDGQLYVLLSRSRDVLQIAYVGEGEPPLLGNPRYRERLSGIELQKPR